MKFFWVTIINFFVLGGFSGPVVAKNNIAIVKNVSGEVMLVNAQLSMAAVPNMSIGLNDTIKTGKDGYVGILFEDDTVLSIGPGSEMAIPAYVFNPAEEQLSFIARLIRGTFSFLTGQIARLAPEKFKVTTPNATLGVRGTKFVVKIE